MGFVWDPVTLYQIYADEEYKWSNMNKRKSNCLDTIKVRLMVALLSRALPSLGQNISCTTSGTDQAEIHKAASRGFTYNQGS